MERLMSVLVAIGVMVGFVGMISSVATYYSAGGIYAAFGVDVGTAVDERGGEASPDLLVLEKMGEVEVGPDPVICGSQSVALTEPHLGQVVASFERIALLQGVAWAFVSMVLSWLLFLFERRGFLVGGKLQKSSGIEE